jgi:hypothetical protein
LSLPVSDVYVESVGFGSLLSILGRESDRFDANVLVGAAESVGFLGPFAEGDAESRGCNAPVRDTSAESGGSDATVDPREPPAQDASVDDGLSSLRIAAKVTCISLAAPRIAPTRVSIRRWLARVFLFVPGFASEV